MCRSLCNTATPSSRKSQTVQLKDRFCVGLIRFHAQGKIRQAESTIQLPQFYSIKPASLSWAVIQPKERLKIELQAVLPERSVSDNQLKTHFSDGFFCDPSLPSTRLWITAVKTVCRTFMLTFNSEREVLKLLLKSNKAASGTSNQMFDIVAVIIKANFS